MQLPTGPRLSAGPDKPGTALQAVLDTMRVLVLDEAEVRNETLLCFFFFFSVFLMEFDGLPRQARDRTVIIRNKRTQNGAFLSVL